MKNSIISHIPTECPWRDTLYWHCSLPSTNDLAKALAKENAPQGTVILADTQSAGRGRLGRSFQSPAGCGVYLSVILRPQRPASELMHLTCAVGVAMVRAIQRTAGITPGLKWINDLVWQGKKLGGILTELSVDAKTGLVDHAVVGVGINCRKADGSLSAEVEQIALSLSEAAGRDIQPEALAGQMIYALWEMDLSDRKAVMDAYRALCLTLGARVTVSGPEGRFSGKALQLRDDGALLVQSDNADSQWICSGEVSVRGLWDYV